MNSPESIFRNGHKHVLYRPATLTDDEMIVKSKNYFDFLQKRRSIREFSDKPVPKTVIENIIRTASTAPSGAHKQPWTFCVVSDMRVKADIRRAAEKEERLSYEKRMSSRWKKDLEVLATNSDKPFLEVAPYLIIVFKKMFDYDEQGNKQQNYYVNESVGIACGMLITAIHNAGLVTMTHTPSPMKFLSDILHRPDNEKPFLLLPVGHPKTPVYVPDLQRKKLAEIAVFH